MNYREREYKGIIYNELEKLTIEASNELLNEIENDINYNHLEIENMMKLKKELIHDEYYYDKSTEIRGMRKLYHDEILNLKHIRNTLIAKLISAKGRIYSKKLCR